MGLDHQGRNVNLQLRNQLLKGIYFVIVIPSVFIISGLCTGQPPEIVKLDGTMMNGPYHQTPRTSNLMVISLLNERRKIYG
jgi:hypothetical protein